MLCLDCTFGVLVEESSVTRFSLFCLYLHCAVMFTVLFGVSSGGQSFRLSSLVGEVWVVCYYLFLCGLLSLSLSCMDLVGIFCYIYSLANYVSINYFFVLFYLLTVLGEWSALVFCVLLKIVLGCSLLCLCSLAGGGSYWCCCSVHTPVYKSIRQ